MGHRVWEHIYNFFLLKGTRALWRNGPFVWDWKCSEHLVVPESKEGIKDHWAGFPLDKLLTETIWVDNKSNNYGLKHINCVKIHDFIILKLQQ